MASSKADNKRPLGETETRPDESPFLSAYSGVVRSLSGSLGRLMRGSDSVQDLMQDVFCRLWTRRSSLHTEDEAAALTATTARHMAIDSWRRGSRRTFMEVDDERDADAASSFASSSLTASAEDDFAIREQYDIVTRLISQELTPLQQQVIQMRDVEGRPYAEIAQELGIEETAVRMNLSRARKKIRDVYERNYGMYYGTED